jgi:hypothetical protein
VVQGGGDALRSPTKDADMGAMESVSTINSLVRTVLAVVIVGGIGTAGWFGYSTVRSHELEG